MGDSPIPPGFEQSVAEDWLRLIRLGRRPDEVGRLPVADEPLAQAARLCAEAFAARFERGEVRFAQGLPRAVAAFCRELAGVAAGQTLSPTAIAALPGDVQAALVECVLAGWQAGAAGDLLLPPSEVDPDDLTALL